MRLMSDDDDLESIEIPKPPPPCTSEHCHCSKDQTGLTQALLQSPDPQVRILAHISNRQLAMVESISILTGIADGNARVLERFRRTLSNGLTGIHTRMDALEKMLSVSQEQSEDSDTELSLVGSIPPD